MQLESSASCAAPRFLRQPGPVLEDRYEILSDGNAVSFRAMLGTGQSLVEAIEGAVREATGGRYRSAAVTLLYGSFQPCVYCLAAEDASGRTVATYTAMRVVDEAMILGGSATLGESMAGEPMIHCHAWFTPGGEGEILGGHLDPSRTRIGTHGLAVLITVLGSLRVRQVPDAETNHAIFTPVGHFGDRE